MPAFATIARILGLSSLCGTASAAVACDTRIGCAACLGVTAPDGSSQCKWCYSSNQCARNDAVNAEWCPMFATHPAVCPCEPAAHDECHSCVSKLGCVWVEAGTMNITSKLPGAFSIARARNWDGVCWSGSMFAGPMHVMDVFTPSDGYKVTTSRKADAWYWGQCGLKNYLFGWTLFLLLAGTLAMGLIFRTITTNGDERAPMPGAYQF